MHFVFTRYSSRLNLIRVKEEDGGVYTLVVQNDAETKTTSFELQIKGKYTMF